MQGTWVKFRRCKRHDVPGQAHYLTFSCWRRQKFLDRDRTRLWLLEAIAAARAAHRFDLWAWVIMPEHVHLLVFPRDGTLVSALLKSIKQPVARLAVAWVREHAKDFLPQMLDRQPSGRQCFRFWQPGGGYDRNIRTGEELHEKIAYIHANPVRRGLVDNPEEWVWSSLRAWQEDVDEPISLDRASLPPIQR